MTKQPTNIGASVRDRLLRLARERGEDFQLVLTRYANERLLFRLATSAHAARFVLKGATLFTLWTGRPHRATRDLDLLGFGDPSQAHLRRVFVDVLALDVPDDGVQFDVDTLTVGAIREDQAYGGVRLELIARVTNAQVRLQVDVGFGDAITPEATIVEVPPLLAFPAPRLRAYPRETVVAEKLEAIVQLGMTNTRMKDFYDLVVLARMFDFDGDLVVRAIRATFDCRKTLVPADRPIALTPAFAEDATKQTQWTAFGRKAGLRDAGTLPEAVTAIVAFLEKPILAARAGTPLGSRWNAGGTWS